MLDSITLKFGETPAISSNKIKLEPITVFVGPNNSGKSRVLQEIESRITTLKKNESNLILSDIVFLPIPEEEIKNELEKCKVEPSLNDNLGEGEIIVSRINPRNWLNNKYRFKYDELLSQARNPNNSYQRAVIGIYMGMFTVRLDGENRINLLKPMDTKDLKAEPVNHLHFLFKNDFEREKLRKVIFDAFNLYFVIDPTNPGKLGVRLSNREPKNNYEERGWHNEAVEFHKNAVDIELMSDGVKAFTGIMTILYSIDPKVILIDEPEAFLHPSLSSKLGKEVGLSAKYGEKKIIVSTHSSNFLMGLIQSNVPLNIIRLTYENNVATSRVLPNEEVAVLMKNPLLRSTGVLNGLFYKSVIVAESDSDRAFYQEINERLLAIDDPRGISDCLFINAQNKQTVWDIVKPLRNLGIPAIGIVDIDVIKDGGQVWTKVMKGGFIPELSFSSLNQLRSSIKRKFEDLEIKMKTEGGISALSKMDQEGANQLFDKLNEYGIFIVRNGELESWLKELAVKGHGPNWLIAIFEKMGDDPENPNYIHPRIGDVWDFLGSAKKWLSNPNRNGIPQAHPAQQETISESVSKS